jgi:hypothetical protein
MAASSGRQAQDAGRVLIPGGPSSCGRHRRLHCQTLVDPDQSRRLLVYTAVPGTESHTSLRLLSVLGQSFPA